MRKKQTIKLKSVLQIGVYKILQEDSKPILIWCQVLLPKKFHNPLKQISEELSSVCLLVFFAFSIRTQN